MPLFDVYVMVDWSAATRPTGGADSIWIGVVRRAATGKPHADPPINLRTRHAAEAHLSALFAEARRAGLRLLAGFDFPFGYPRGTADWLEAATVPEGRDPAPRKRLDGQPPPWHRIWTRLSEGIRDAPDNTNNRFDWAAGVNRATGGAGPFWGYPSNARAANPALPRAKPPGYGTTLPLERRLADRLAKGAETVWHLANGAGVVGSQSLLGIPVLARLRDHPALRDAVRIWPFETGLRPPDDTPLVFAEIWPSLFDVRPDPGEVKDAAQVRAVAQTLAERDRRDALAPFFTGPPDLTDRDRQAIETEEAWILGLDGPRPRAFHPIEE